jgi:hypothetical protein
MKEPKDHKGFPSWTFLLFVVMGFIRGRGAEKPSPQRALNC